MANHTSDDELRKDLLMDVAAILHRHFPSQRNTTVEAHRESQGELIDLITAREQAAYKAGYIQCGLDSQEKAK